VQNGVVFVEWAEVLEKDPIKLNLGGAEFCHPHPDYRGYVTVDLDSRDHGWNVRHDLMQPIPLPDGCVTSIHSEDFLEHIPLEGIERLLAECFRLLKSGGRMRIGVPDYRNPKDRWCLETGLDPRYPTHVTLTHYELMKQVFDRSPFDRYQIYHYWDGDNFVENPIDYSFGKILRTPDNHPKNRIEGPVQRVKTAVRDALFRLSKGFRVTGNQMDTRKNHRLHVTSLTADLFRD
jgi:predicted SAM-dependent methyltransferase